MATTAVAPAKATSVFADVPEAPADPILGLNSAFLADEAPNKISLGVGAFRTDEGKPYVLPVVKRVEQQLVRFSCFLIASFPFWSSGVVRGRKRRGGGGAGGRGVLRRHPGSSAFAPVWLRGGCQQRARPAG